MNVWPDEGYALNCLQFCLPDSETTRYVPFLQ